MSVDITVWGFHVLVLALIIVYRCGMREENYRMGTNCNVVIYKSEAHGTTFYKDGLFYCNKFSVAECEVHNVLQKAPVTVIVAFNIFKGYACLVLLQ